MGGEPPRDPVQHCELPLENLVIRDDGFRKLLNAFNTWLPQSEHIAWLAEGAEEARKYVRDRTVFGRDRDYQGVR
jgi:hypothetical protein